MIAVLNGSQFSLSFSLTLYTSILYSFIVWLEIYLLYKVTRCFFSLPYMNICFLYVARRHCEAHHGTHNTILILNSIIDDVIIHAFTLALPSTYMIENNFYWIMRCVCEHYNIKYNKFLLLLKYVLNSLVFYSKNLFNWNYFINIFFFFFTDILFGNMNRK